MDKSQLVGKQNPMNISQLATTSNTPLIPKETTGAVSAS